MTGWDELMWKFEAYPLVSVLFLSALLGLAFELVWLLRNR